jgi:hypothetical protein
MKNLVLRALVLVVAVAFVVPVASNAFAENKGPEKTVIEHVKNVKGACEFPHAKHQAVEGVTCNKCHHKEAETKCSKCHQKDATKDAAGKDVPKAQEAYHDQCKKCHQEHKAKDEAKYGKLPLCNTCHNK